MQHQELQDQMEELMKNLLELSGLQLLQKQELVTEKHVFGNDRITNIKRFSLAALNLLRKQIISQ